MKEIAKCLVSSFWFENKGSVLFSIFVMFFGAMF